jgi:hypothetical protein
MAGHPRADAAAEHDGHNTDDTEEGTLCIGPVKVEKVGNG